MAHTEKSAEAKIKQHNRRQKEDDIRMVLVELNPRLRFFIIYQINLFQVIESIINM